MATQLRSPTSTSATANVTITGAATVHEALDDAIASPNDADYVAQASVAGSFRCQVPAFAFTSASVQKVTLRFRLRSNVAGGVSIFGRLRKNSVNYDTSAVVISGPVNTWQLVEIDYLVNPATGVAWVDAADINLNMTGGINGYGANGSGINTGETLDISAFEVMATYTAPPSSPPGNISNLDGTAVSSTQVDLTWTAASGATSHRIERATIG